MNDILDTLDDLDDEESQDYTDDDFGLGGFSTDMMSPENVLDTDLAAGIDDILASEGQMGETEAREITEAIRAAATATYVLLTRAHEGKAYSALGYETWAEYVRMEFEISPQRSYQLLDLSKAVKMIESATPDGTDIKLTEAQARDIKRELPRITERVHEETKDLPPEEARDRVNEIIREEREQARIEEKAVKKREEELAEAEEEGYRAGLEAAADALLEADAERQAVNDPDDGLVDTEVQGNPPSPNTSKLMHDFVNVLLMVQRMPDPQEVCDLISDERLDDFADKVNDAAGWMNRLGNLLDLRY